MSPGASGLDHVDALAAAGATVFRAFSTTGWEQMAQPLFDGERCDLPWAGPDDPAREHVEHLIADLGFRSVSLGEGRRALDLIDALTRLWFLLAYELGWGRRVGIRLLADSEPATAPRS